MIKFLWIKQRSKRLLSILMAVILMAGVMPAVAVAREPAHPEISVAQAVALSLANSESLKNAKSDITKQKELRDDASDDLDFIPSSSSGTAATENPWYSLLTADISLQSVKKAYTTEEEKIALDSYSKYWDILKYQDKLEVAELGAKKALLALQNAQAGNRVGTVADIDLLSATSQRQTAVTTLSLAQNSLDDAYEALNSQIGLWPEDRPVLTDTVKYSLADIDNLDNEVARVLADSPTIWSADQAVILQNYSKNMMFYSGSYTPYKVRQIGVEQAELDAASAKEVASQSVRDMYYQIKNMEQNYSMLQEQIKLAEENLRVSKVNFEIGMTTALNVCTAEKALADAKSSFLELICNHEYAKLVFEKPWAAS